jgi:hypothetical protein
MLDVGDCWQCDLKGRRRDRRSRSTAVVQSTAEGPTEPDRGIVFYERSGFLKTPKSVNRNHSPPGKIPFPQEEANGSWTNAPASTAHDRSTARESFPAVSAEPGKPADRDPMIRKPRIIRKLEVREEPRKTAGCLGSSFQPNALVAMSSN